MKVILTFSIFLLTLVVYGQPAISNFSPATVRPGMMLTIAGENFNPITSENDVFIGNIRATVVSGGSSSLVVQVPIGAAHSFITVTDKATKLTGYSTKLLIVNFEHCSPINEESFEGAVRGLQRPSAPSGLKLADMDSDGQLDYVCSFGTNGGTNAMGISLNHSTPGAIAFDPYHFFYSMPNGYTINDVGDFNGDGKPDLAANWVMKDSMSVFISNSTPGSLSFPQKLTFPTLSSTTDLHVHDMDSDGKPDIVVTHACDPKIRIYRNTSTAGNVSFVYQDFISYYTYRIAIGDLNGDGKPEIVGASNDKVVVIRNLSTPGTLNFAWPSLRVDIGSPSSSSFGVRLGDMDGDGNLDVLVARRNGFDPAWFSILRNTTLAGALAFASPTQVPCGPEPYDFELHDLDGDGKLDILSNEYEWSTNNIATFANTSSPGSISFGPRIAWSSGYIGPKIEAGDIDNDGRIDLVSTGRHTSSYDSWIWVHRNLQCDDWDVQSACQFYTWIDGVTYTESNNTATHTLTDMYGNDSLVRLKLTISHPTSTTDVRTACGSFTWIDGNTYTSDNNTATFTLTNAAGCDSVVHLDLTIHQPDATVENVFACSSHNWNGTTYTLSGTYTQTLTNTYGCDSVATINLTVLSPSSGSETVAACGSYTWGNGTIYTQSGTYIDTLTGAHGCDSIATIFLTINELHVSSEVVSACDSYTWSDGNTYTASGVYTQHFVDQQGCDSNLILNLTIYDNAGSVQTISACGSYTWTNGQTYTSSGTYVQTITNGAGCTATATLHLSISPSYDLVETVIVCDSYTWSNGINYTSSGTYIQTLSAVSGCDSIRTLHLTVNQSYDITETIQACGDYTWSDGVTYTQSGTYTQSLTTNGGCDSLRTLHLTVYPNEGSTEVASACDVYFWKGEYYTSSGIYERIFTNVNGCDSLERLELTVNQTYSSHESIEACTSYIWTDGITYSETGTYVQQFSNSHGCDSNYYLHLTVYPTGEDFDTVNVCGSYTWIDGMTYSESGVYTHTSTIAGGCELLSTLYLTIFPTEGSTLEVEACDFYLWEGDYYVFSGNYSKTFENIFGCDSVVNLHLTVNQSFSSWESVDACGSYTWWNGVTYTESGAYTHTFTNVAGCDSVFNLNLYIAPTPEVFVTENENGWLIASGATYYHWYNCTTNEFVPGAWSTMFLPEENGVYAAVGNNGDGCDDISDCYAYNFLSVNQLSEMAVLLYPNPANDEVKVEFSGNEAQLVMRDAAGKLVIVKTILSGQTIDVSELASGVYVVEIVSDSGKAIRRLVKN